MIVRSTILKLKIEDYCIRCGICVTFYSELFEMDFAEDVVRIKSDEIPETLKKKARQSIKDCAVTAIHFDK
jgi:ferredoxin